MEARRLDEWLSAIQGKAPESAAKIRSEIPQNVSDALDMALKQTSAERPKSIREFMQMLEL